MTGTRPPPTGEVGQISGSSIVATRREKSRAKVVRETNNRVFTDQTDPTDPTAVVEYLAAGAQTADNPLADKRKAVICHTLAPAALVTGPATIGAPETDTWTRATQLNRLRVAAYAARGEDTVVGSFEYDGRFLTLLVRLRKLTGDERYLTEAEADAYAPDLPTRMRFNATLRRAMTALVSDIVARRIKLDPKKF